MADSDGPFFAMSSPQSGLGDTQPGAGPGPDREPVVQASVGYPRAMRTFGERFTDWASRRCGRGRCSPPARRLATTGVSGSSEWGNGADRLTPGSVYTAIVGGSWRWPKFSLKAQLDLHGASTTRRSRSAIVPSHFRRLAAGRAAGDDRVLRWSKISRARLPTSCCKWRRSGSGERDLAQVGPGCPKQR
jgi:hypothetical protein